MAPGDLLTRIADARRRRVDLLQKVTPLPVLRERARGRIPRRDFARTLALPRAGPLPVRIIAEIKRASPSEGLIRESLDPQSLAGDLVAAGADALSVLTEPGFFQGKGVFLNQCRRGAPHAPLLRKDFLLDPWQVWESRLLGADAVLLITTLLPGSLLTRMLKTAEEASLEVLVEVKSQGELDTAVAAGARVIGFNARNLSDFSVDLRRVERLAAAIPAGVTAVAESGVRSRDDLLRLGNAGFHAVLVGTALMREKSPGETLAAWLAGAPLGKETG
ncbi:MAG: indole-3-glycerol-phosphate synthase [Acidobacteriota bacterium]